MRWLKSLAGGLIVAVGLYYTAGAYILRYRLDPLLFPSSEAVGKALAPAATRIVGASGNELLVHRYGEARIGCAIFFPGQHGELASYQETLFRKLVDAGVAVFAVSYPGQDGAAGAAALREIPELSRRAILSVMQDCAPHRTAVLGRSLGAFVAVYASAGTSPAGLVLDSTAPTLSSAIAARIRSRWYLRPLALLPVRTLLQQDYSMAAALAHLLDVTVVVFQGTADQETPIRDLSGAGILPANVQLVPVAGGGHSDTFRLALNTYVQVVLRLIRAQRPVAKTS